MSRDILWRKKEKAINIQNGILKVRLIDPLYGLKKDILFYYIIRIIDVFPKWERSPPTESKPLANKDCPQS